MGKISISKYEIDRIRVNKLDIIASGHEGSCYYFGDKQVIKLFHILNGNRKINFENYKSNNIAFPIDIYYYEDSNLIAGYTMNYCLGNNICLGLKESLLIEELLVAYNKISQELKKYSDIYMNDLVGENILYDYQNQQINLIDTNSWYQKKDSFARNISKINAELIAALLYTIKIQINVLKKYPKLYKLYLEYKDILQGFRYLDAIFDLDLFERFIEELIKNTELKKEKVMTIGDLKIKC